MEEDRAGWGRMEVDRTGWKRIEQAWKRRGQYVRGYDRMEEKRAG